ncbi:MAG TPA: IS630 family transposase [Candidatus Binatia bacterium]|nr:IS630 family transposase [Candidatus Binatia bacterium]
MPGPQPKYAITLAPEQEARLQQLSTCYRAPFATVQRAQIILLAHRHPQWQNATIAQRLGCHVNTVKRWRQRWQRTDSLHDAPRTGTRRTFTPLQRAQVVALACGAPRQSGKPWQRWSGEKLAQVAVEQQIVEAIAPGTVRRWLRADKIKPWRYHSWQHSTDPQFVEKATPVLDLYAQAPALQAQGELTVCADEKTSIQARQRVTATKAAAPGEVMQVADRYKRMGALQLFCALVVASGLTFAQTRASKKFVDFTAFLQAFFQSALCVGVKVLHLILDNGPTHAPKQLGAWLASLELPFAVRLYWLPKYASWLDQVEIIFSKVQRDVLTPNDFPSTLALERNLQAYFTELNEHPKPIQWTYTETQLLAKCGVPPPSQLAA